MNAKSIRKIGINGKGNVRIIDDKIVSYDVLKMCPSATTKIYANSEYTSLGLKAISVEQKKVVNE